MGIITAALKEFAKNGYERASTNEIIKDADISKGSLFNYFNSKKELYIYLLDYAMNIVEDLFKVIDLNEKDIFKRIGNIGIQKLQVHREHPYVFDFLASAQTEESKETEDIIGEKTGFMYEGGMAKLYEDIDYSKFREDIDIEKAIEILNWTMFGFGEKSIKKLNVFKDSTEFDKSALLEWEIYSNMLKDSFYK